MKTFVRNIVVGPKRLLAPTVYLALAIASSVCSVAAAETAAKPPGKARIGVYNSRAVALAYGRSEINQDVIKKLQAEAEKAKAAGDKERLAELNKEGGSRQNRLHSQVFGNAPIDDILETIKEALPEIQAKAGVQKIVAQDPRDPALEVVDVTALLVQHFKPTEKTLRMIEDLKKHPPLGPHKFPLKD